MTEKPKASFMLISFVTYNTNSWSKEKKPNILNYSSKKKFFKRNLDSTVDLN